MSAIAERVDVAPLGLSAEPELWIIVAEDGSPYECHKHRDGTDWVIAARNERDVLNAHASMPDHPDMVEGRGRAARTTEISLRTAILGVVGRRVEGWVIFDSAAMVVREERVH